MVNPTLRSLVCLDYQRGFSRLFTLAKRHFIDLSGLKQVRDFFGL